jgi:hypothetical protein
MKSMLALLMIAGVGVGIGACGAESTSPHSASGASSDSEGPTPAVVQGPMAHVAGSRSYYLRDDGDKDDDELRPPKREDDDRNLFATYNGHTSQADTSAITALVKNYYAASAAGNAVRACSLLDVSLASSLGAESPRVQGVRAGCAEALAPLLAQQHQRLIAENPSTIVVVSVHVRGRLGLVAVGFRTTPKA